MHEKEHLLGVTGRIQTRNYENQQGQRVYVTEVVADNFQLLESRSNNEKRQDDKSQQNTNTNNVESDPFNGSSIDIGDDDLPF
jgi:single-strand DNA-binding protein